jgi:glutamine amidotransferase
MKKVAVIDYGAGNQKNIFRAIKAINCEPVLVKTKKDLVGINYIIVPGMGSFSVAVKNLKETGLFEALVKAANEGGEDKGLAILKGKILPLESFCDLDFGYKIPVMGWYKIDWNFKEDENNFSKIIGTISGEHMYFAHSYGVVLDDKDIELASLNYFNSSIVAAIKKDNIFGTQFHPEKSGEAGLKILEAFVS